MFYLGRPTAGKSTKLMSYWSKSTSDSEKSRSKSTRNKIVLEVHSELSTETATRHYTPGVSIVLNATYINKMSFFWLNCYQAPCHASSSRLGTSLLSGQCSSSIFVLCGCVNGWTLDSSCVLCGMLIRC